MPASLEEIIHRCLAFGREDRPGSAEALDAMLEACDVAPPWKLDDARAWWRNRGEAALTAARAHREEHGQVLILASGDHARS